MIDDLKKLKIIMIIGLPFILFFIIFMVLLVNDSSSTGAVAIGSDSFAIPFEDDAYYYVSSEFGNRRDPFNKSNFKFHTGIDFGAGAGTKVLASADGFVVEVGYSVNGFGNYVYIEHNIDGVIYYTAYGHMQDNSIVVIEGQPVKQSELIGRVGTTGNSTGNHLHFSIMTPKKVLSRQYLVNPRDYLKDLK